MYHVINSCNGSIEILKSFRALKDAETYVRIFGPNNMFIIRLADVDE